MSQAIDNKDTKIYIVDTGTAPSDLADSDLFKGEITEVSDSGAEREQETTQTFGGQITRTQPRTEIELSMEITPAQDTEIDWVSFFFGEDTSNTGYYTSALEPKDKDVYIEASDSNDTTTHGYRNLQAVSEEMSHPADDVRTMSLTFNTSPQTQDGSPNYAFGDDTATNFPAWDTFDKA